LLSYMGIGGSVAIKSLLLSLNVTQLEAMD
jgi:hypothetical protein